MAYHHLQVCRNRWFPRRLRAHQRRGSLHRHGHLHHRHIWRQLLDSRLVRIYLRSDAREEGCRYRYRDDCYERFVHLDSVLVAQVGRAKICYCAELFGGVLDCDVCACVGCEDCVYAQEQEAP
jgi:hypothetical protein